MTERSNARAGGVKKRVRARKAVTPKLPELPKGDDSEPKFDVFDSSKRSEIMSKVKSTKNRSTELRLLEEFKRLKIVGWRRGSKIFGKPDFLFPKLRIAVFVDGCFWHGHDCRNTKPKDHADYWRIKIERNKKRDRDATDHLTKLGYCVVRVWECDFKKANAERLQEKLSPIVQAYAAYSQTKAAQDAEQKRS